MGLSERQIRLTQCKERLGCAAYSRCYDQTLASFITLNSTVAEEDAAVRAARCCEELQGSRLEPRQERTLRQEWRAVLRIECPWQEITCIPCVPEDAPGRKQVSPQSALE